MKTLRFGAVASPIVTGTVAVALSLGLSACRSEPEPVQTSMPSVERSDTWITTSVQAKYYADDTVRAGEIDVSTNDGVVTLSGTVQDEAAKQQAVQLAQQVEGVSRVDDQLQIGTAAAATQAQEPSQQARGPEADEQQPTGTAGTEGRVEAGWITTKIQAQYFMNPEVKPWNIDVTTTSDGTVTLSGEVEAEADRTEAARIARETEGVKSVNNRLRLKGEPAAAGERGGDEAEYGPNQPDPWITAKVQSKYFLDDEVKGRNINVDTRDGVVTLTGTVASEAERRQALALARNTDGVRDVTDNLEVKAEETPAGTTGAAKEPKQAMKQVPPLDQKAHDAWLTTTIQSKYFLDADVKGYQINVNTNKGVVTLEGKVASDAIKQQAGQIASDTSGVKKVNNQLTVK